MPDIDRALAAISHWGKAPLARAREALVLCSVPASQANRALIWMEALGHVALDWKAGTVQIQPAHLARQPVYGLPRATLCGYRTPAFLKSIKHKQAGIVWTSAEISPTVPSALHVVADDEKTLADWSASRGLSYGTTPSAWGLVGADNLEAYESRLAWRDQRDLDWSGRDYDPNGCRWSSRRDDPVRLAEFRDPRTGQPRHFLRDVRLTAECSPDWGKYMLLKRLGKAVVAFDVRRQVLSLPAGALPPPLILRGLALCSGTAPREQDGRLLFTQVSQDLASRACRSLGQPSEALP